MALNLPKVIAAYFDADNKGEANVLSTYFAENAIVKDEGNTYTGRNAIREWIANASTQYSYTVEPLSLSEENGKIIVTSHLVGNFPGSPVDLRYFFKLRNDEIAELEIIP
ncbi:nuclear transport factor 2 family protein [Ponticaulis profundi]|uniref:Nuclear transport factor 2 family protein n=1 Tax=Ponticaulis profundi TaxID=2665222 RepID=A0ABW1S7S7_9PROT